MNWSTINDSTVTKLAWLGIVAWLLNKFIGERLTSKFWIGYGIGCAVLFYIMSRVVNPPEGDPVQDWDETPPVRPGGIIWMPTNR